MSDSVLISIIMSCVSLAGTIIGARAGIKEASKLTGYRLNALEAKMDKHNNLVERLTRVEATVATALPLLKEHTDDQIEFVSDRFENKEQISKERLDKLAQQINHG